MKNKYYSLVKNKDKQEADLTIFGDITSMPWTEADTSSYNLSKQLQELNDVKTINVHINSYGGEVAEGLAIYNSLKNHSAKVKTYCDGFACSIASVIFMAGDVRIMSNASLLMIHNAWSVVMGNSNELRKQADDLDKITQASVNAYMNHINISEAELKKLLDNETWLDSNEALEKGFATKVINNSDSDKASQNVRQSLIKMILANQEETSDEEDEEIEVTADEVDNDKEEVDIETETDEEEVAEEDETKENPETDEEDSVEETDDEDETEIKEDPNKEDDEVTERAVAFFNAIANMKRRG